MPPKKISKAVRRDRRAFGTLPTNAVSRNYIMTRSQTAIARSENPEDLHAELPKTTKQFRCILCHRRFASRRGVDRHFGTHRAIPTIGANGDYPEFLPAMADPTCWPEPAVVLVQEWTAMHDRLNVLKRTPEPTDLEESVMFYREMMRLVRGCRNQAEAKAYKLMQKLRMWEWWFTEQAATPGLGNMLRNEQAAFRVTGDAGATNQELRREENTLGEALSGVSIPTVLVTAMGSGPAECPRPNEPGNHPCGPDLFAPFLARSHNSRMTSTDEFPTAGPLNAAPILRCISDANTAFVERVGETRDARDQISTAMSEFLEAIDADDRVDELANYGAKFKEYQEDDEDVMDEDTRRQHRRIFYMHQFRVDRGEVFRVIKKGVADYFLGVDEEPVEEGEDDDFEEPYEEAGTIECEDPEWAKLLKATRRYAERLEDNKTMREVEMYADRERWIAHVDGVYGDRR